MQALKKSKAQDSIVKVYACVRNQVSKNVSAKFKTQQNPVLRQSEHGTDTVIATNAAGSVRPSAGGK
jgi:hypothetical protein